MSTLVEMRCVPGWRLIRRACKYIGNTARDRRLFTIGSLWESGQTESIGDVTDDVT